MDTSKNPWENIPEPELVPVTPDAEIEHKPSIFEIEGALKIIQDEESGVFEREKSPRVYH